MTSAVFDALPGTVTPVADVVRTLAAIWDAEPAAGAGGGGAPTEFRASQMNLVLHFGLEATPEFAQNGFATALDFSRRHPCRIIVLCPRPFGGEGGMSAKIFCECFLGGARDEKTCTEAIMLTYALEERAHLENQASILLESDLPVCYWPQRFQCASRLGDYRLFLRVAHRIVIDSALEKPDLPAYPWPRPGSVRDLVFARLLPLRQAIGHFLSYRPPAQLAGGLESVEMVHRPEFAAEARTLLAWMEGRLRECDRVSDPVDAGTLEASFELRSDPALAGSLHATWRYEGGGRLAFWFDLAEGASRLESDFGGEQSSVGASVRLAATEAALAEAVFH